MVSISRKTLEHCVVICSLLHHIYFVINRL